MSESTMRQRVVRALKLEHALAVENPIQPGTPDVNFIEGWLELKWLRRWPYRCNTTVRIEHFTIQQRRWLDKRWKLGGNVWLLLQVQREWLLFSGPVAREMVGYSTRQGLYDCARVRWTAGLNNKELRECLHMEWESWNGSPLVRPSSSTVEDAARAN